FIAKQIEKCTNNRKTDNLRNQMRPVHSKSPGYLSDLPASFRKQENSIHNRTPVATDGRPISPGTRCRTRLPQRKRSPESIEPAPSWTPRDCDRLLQRPSYRLCRRQ